MPLMLIVLNYLPFGDFCPAYIDPRTTCISRKRGPTGITHKSAEEFTSGKELVVPRSKGSTREVRVTISGFHVQIRKLISRERKEITFD